MPRSTRRRLPTAPLGLRHAPTIRSTGTAAPCGRAPGGCGIAADVAQIRKRRNVNPPAWPERPGGPGRGHCSPLHGVSVRADSLTPEEARHPPVRMKRSRSPAGHLAARNARQERRDSRGCHSPARGAQRNERLGSVGPYARPGRAVAATANPGSPAVRAAALRHEGRRWQTRRAVPSWTTSSSASPGRPIVARWQASTRRSPLSRPAAETRSNYATDAPSRPWQRSRASGAR
jgi:hypothetical protein